MINDEVKALVQGKNFATIPTLLPKGQIQTHVVWVDCDDDHNLINTEVELRRFKNVQADPRVTVTVWDKKILTSSPVRGHVVGIVTGPEAWANINTLAQKYLEADYPDKWIYSERVILKIAPDSQIVFAVACTTSGGSRHGCHSSERRVGNRATPRSHSLRPK